MKKYALFFVLGLIFGSAFMYFVSNELISENKPTRIYTLLQDVSLENGSNIKKGTRLTNNSSFQKEVLTLKLTVNVWPPDEKYFNIEESKHYGLNIPYYVQAEE